MLPRFAVALSALALLLFTGRAFADDEKLAVEKPAAKSGGSAKNGDAKSGDAKAGSKSGETKDEISATTGESSSSSGGGSGGEAKSKYAPFPTVTKDYKQVSGLVTLWHKEGSVLAEFSPHTLNRDFIVVISIARGIGHGHILGGMSWG